MISEKINIPTLRDFLIDAKWEIDELLKLCEIVDFMEDPGKLECEYIELGEVFDSVEMDSEQEDKIVTSAKEAVGSIKTIIDTIKGSVFNGEAIRS